MKKIIIFVLLFCTVALISNHQSYADFTFYDSHADHATIPRSDYLNGITTTNIDGDGLFGDSYLVGYHTYGTTSIINYKNWLGIATNKSVPKYDILVYRYPIMLDTFLADPDFFTHDFSFQDFNVTMVVNNEIITEDYSFSDSEVETERFYLESSFDYISESLASASIPYYGITMGLEMSSSLQLHVEGQYEYTTQRTISYNRSGTVTIDNTPTSPYYQNGKIIYANYGIRALYYLQVVVICEPIYQLDYTYTVGTWPNKKTYYVYKTTYAHYNTIYSSYDYHSAYNRGEQPFIYVFNSANQSYELVDQFREEDRVYIR